MNVDAIGLPVSAFVGVVYGLGEHFQVFNTPISKYRSPKLRQLFGTIDARTGMIALYSVALLFMLIFIYFETFGATANKIGAGLFVLHFCKRVVECAVVHIYSAPLDTFTVVYLATSYVVIAAAFAYDTSVSSSHNESLGAQSWWCSIPIFLVGQIVNGYHHWLLRQLRLRHSKKIEEGSDDQSAYVLPTGGLFGFVLHPHYLGEMISWAGTALAVNRGLVYGIVLFMFFMQTGRASAGKQWYKEKFGKDVSNRWALFPGIV